MMEKEAAAEAEEAARRNRAGGRARQRTISFARC